MTAFCVVAAAGSALPYQGGASVPAARELLSVRHEPLVRGDQGRGSGVLAVGLILGLMSELFHHQHHQRAENFRFWAETVVYCPELVNVYSSSSN